MLALVLFLAPPASTTIWHVPGDFATIQNAIDSSSVVDGDKIQVGPRNNAGALVDKEVEIKGEPETVIDSGPTHSSRLVQGFRLLAGSDGTTICQLWFEGVDLAIMNKEAVNNVTVTQNTLTIVKKGGLTCFTQSIIANCCNLLNQIRVTKNYFLRSKY